MKKNLQTLIWTLSLLFLTSYSNGQTTVTINTSGTWIGYMNVFDLANNYQFGSFWGLPDVKSTISAATNTVTLQPNFNTYANAATAADSAYWHNGVIGNKIMEANTFLESTTLTGQNVTFQGNVLSNTLDASYTATAFVKALDPANGYVAVVNQTLAIPASGSFAVTAAIPATTGLIVQYGFTIVGLNANPVAETSLGSIVVGPAIPLSLKLVSFDAKFKNTNVNIDWTTEDEELVKAFELQRSTNGITFENVQTILPKNNTRNQYAVSDNLVSNEVYYRLKIINTNNEFNYSNIVKANVRLANDITLYPNPASDVINVLSGAVINHVVIYNWQGIKITTINTAGTNAKLDISALPNGVYFMQIQNGNMLPFVKQ